MSFLNRFLIGVRSVFDSELVPINGNQLRDLEKGDVEIAVVLSFLAVYNSAMTSGRASPLLIQFNEAVRGRSRVMFNDDLRNRIVVELRREMVIMKFNNATRDIDMGFSFVPKSVKNWNIAVPFMRAGNLKGFLLRNFKPHDSAKGGSMLNSKGLEISPKVWAATVLHYVTVNGNDFVKARIKTEEDVLAFMKIEGGLHPNGTVNVTVSNGSFMGPFQVNLDAFNEGPVRFSKLKNLTPSLFAAATKNSAVGGPGDLRVMGPGIVAFWNSKANAALRASPKTAKSMGFKTLDDFKAMVSKVPHSWEALYMMHNQGGVGAIRFMLERRFRNVQSDEAHMVAQQLLKQYDASA